MAKLQNINKGGSATMKNSIKIVSVAMAIVMSFAAVQAFEDTEGQKSSAGPNVDENVGKLRVSGCVLSLHADGQDGITLCPDDGVEGCPVNDDNVANACDHNDGCVEDVITIQGIGPAFYWETAVTLQIDDNDCLPVIDHDGKYIENPETSTITQPGPGENVKIGYYPSQDGEYLIALWVVVDNNTEGGATATAVLLRDQVTLDVLWNNTAGNKTRTNSEE
jgi:hypothetical protein